MKQSVHSVKEALGALKIGSRDRFRVRKCLADGPTNETWLVTRDQERYVLRLIKPQAMALGLSLADELTITTAAGERGLAPPIVASCTTHGIVLSRYVDGRIWAEHDLHDKAQLGRLADTLRNVHKLNCNARPINLGLTVERYASRSTDSRADRWADTIAGLLGTISRRNPVVCHNDVNFANVVDNGKLILLDWEYAALGDPLFDLAVVAAHHELDVSASKHFLFSYLGHDDAGAFKDLNRWRTVYLNLVALWRSGLDPDATEDEDAHHKAPD